MILFEFSLQKIWFWIWRHFGHIFRPRPRPRLDLATLGPKKVTWRRSENLRERPLGLPWKVSKFPSSGNRPPHLELKLCNGAELRICNQLDVAFLSFLYACSRIDILQRQTEMTSKRVAVSYKHYTNIAVPRPQSPSIKSRRKGQWQLKMEFPGETLSCF